MEDLLGKRTFTAREKAEAIVRELTLRRYVYPRRIAAKKMKQETADREIAVMEAILGDYQ